MQKSIKVPKPSLSIKSHFILISLLRWVTVCTKWVLQVFSAALTSQFHWLKIGKCCFGKSKIFQKLFPYLLLMHCSTHQSTPRSSAASASSEGYSLWFTSACFHNITSVSCNAQTPFNEKYLVGFPCLCGKLSPTFSGTFRSQRICLWLKEWIKVINISHRWLGGSDVWENSPIKGTATPTLIESISSIRVIPSPCCDPITSAAL